MDKVEHLDAETVGPLITTDIPKVRITWQNLRLTIVKSVGFRKTEDVEVLKNISGVAEPGKLLAVMGTSGAGKSSLLSILNGGSKPSKLRKICGDVKANGVSIFDLKYNKITGNVLQEDILLASLSVRESIQFSADLRTHLNSDEKESRINKIIDDLRLTKVQHTMIGSNKVRGVSGGEKKRVCIGIELITNPSVLFLDEPTSGLDSFTAFAIMRLIKDQADLGRTVVCTLHQPSSQIFELIDSLLVMTAGHIIYHNKPSFIEQWFSNLDYEFPRLGNPIDFLMHIISIEEERFENKQDKIDYFLKPYIDNLEPIEPGAEDLNLKMLNPPNLAVFEQFKFLLLRSVKETFRNKALLRSKVAIGVVQGGIIDMLFYNLTDDQKGIQNRYGLFFMLNIVLFISGIVQIILTFPLQRAVFLKEKGTDMYGTFTYFWAKILPELYLEVLVPTLMFLMIYWACDLNTSSYDKPLTFWGICLLAHSAGGSIGLFMGCIVTNVDAIAAFIPMIFFPNLVYSGFLANFDSIPIPFCYFTYLSPFRYSFTSMAQNEYHGITFTCEDEEPYPCTPLSDLNIDVSLWRNIIILAAITLAYRFLAALALNRLVKKIYA